MWAPVVVYKQEFWDIYAVIGRQLSRDLEDYAHKPANHRSGYAHISVLVRVTACQSPVATVVVSCIQTCVTTTVGTGDDRP